MMDAGRWDHVQAIFHTAVDLPPGERAAYVTHACAGDADLLAHVHTLITGDQAGSVLDATTADVARDVFDGADSTGVGERIGPYLLTARLGEGGSGVVYLADRDDIGSRVAIKVLRDAWVSPDRRERFRREQRTLAHLAHPAIARIIDAGTLEGGTPWFAMEYVEGRPLDEHCRAEQTDVAGRLRLVRQICAAVQYAHGRLIVHRDIKPSNILVDRDGAPKLLDFGIARQLESLHALSPHTGPLRFLSPGYAAPEELAGAPSGVQTDVYSLGVVLEELLDADAGGRRPHSWFGASALGPGGQADLAVLCDTATHPDCERRYATAAALWHDLDALLAGRPLAARPDSAVYRTRKFIGRHRHAMAAAAVAIVVAAGSGWFYAEGLATARAQTQAEAARSARLLRFVLGVFSGGEDGAAPPSELRVLTLLDRSVQEARSLSGDPLVQAELFHTLGGIYHELGTLDRADRLLNDALDARRTHLGPAHSDVAASMVALASLRLDQSRLPEAETLVHDARTAAERAAPANHPVLVDALTVLGRIQREKGEYTTAAASLEDAVRRYEALPAAIGERAQALAALAETRFYMGDMDAADAVNQRALAVTREARGPTHPDLGHLLINQGAILSSRGEFAAAERVDREALTIFLQWYGEAHPETASAQTTLAQVLGRQAKFEEGAPLLRRALITQEQTYGATHRRTAFVLNEIGLNALRRNDFAAAEVAFRRAVAGYGASAGTHFQEGVVLVNLGRLHLARGAPDDLAAAEQALRRALGIYAEVLPADHVNVGTAKSVLGRVLLRQKRPAEATPLLADALRVLEKQPGPPSPYLTAARDDLAAVR